jgi:hypothetical protein
VVGEPVTSLWGVAGSVDPGYGMSMKRILVFAALAASTACYTYVPVSPAAAPQGTPVRARLSTMSQFELSQITVNNIDQVEG